MRFSKGFIPWNKGLSAPWARNLPQQFKKGSTPWNKDKTGVYTEEHRKKISERMRGRVSPMRGVKLSEEIKKKISMARVGSTPWNKGKVCVQTSGSNHWNWRKDRSKIVGLQTDRGNPEYKRWRKNVLIRDDYRCFDCGEFKRGEMEVDHIFDWIKYPRLRYTEENGQTLCKKCHKAKTTRTRKISKYPMLVHSQSPVQLNTH